VTRNERRLDRQQSEQVHDAVARGHVHRQVVEAVVVDAPDKRAEDLIGGSHHDANPHLQALLARRLEGGEIQDREAESAQQMLLPQRGDPAVSE